MEPFKVHQGIVAAIDRPNIDTDAIIPKQFLRKIEKTGFGQHLFHEWRYLDYEGTRENPDFILNQEAYRQASVLLSRENFGCGSSREHAPWALADFGFKIIIALSFADIFHQNALKNGILTITLSSDKIDRLFDQTLNKPAVTFKADLTEQVLTDAQGNACRFDIHPFQKECLLKGLDQIAWTLQFENKILTFENKIKQKKSWLV
ncbi:MAG: 3-isopropylmalate dehydratase small subunit [Candidatus Omnitrophica bacterium]|nr:3-isopropylmalate dehydratase small subunit [Candidatus Omnitrophota bacterium]